MGLGTIALEVGKSSIEDVDIVDIITFTEASWGLCMPLFPVQRIILKAHYGLMLDDNPYGIDVSEPIPIDHPQYSEIVATKGAEKGFYKHRVVIRDWKGLNPRAMTEAGYLRFLYDEGRSNIREVIPGVELRELVLAIGRRSGKTTLAAIISAYETYRLLMKRDPQHYYGLPSANNIMITSVATDKDQAGLLYSEVSGHYRKCAYFAPYTANNTMSYARFQTPADIDKYGKYSDNPTMAKASLKIDFKSCVAKGLRGRGNIVIILDEIAHFTDSGQSSAKEVYEAITPSISAFTPKDPEDPLTAIGPGEGRIISISSPLGRQGFFYHLYELGMRGTKNFLCIQAPTWEVNPTVPPDEFEKHYLKDPRTFKTEFGAEFSDRTRGWIDEADDLIVCVDASMRPIDRAPPQRSHWMGIDFALVGDATAVAIGHVDEQARVVADLVTQIKAGEGDFKSYTRLDFDEVADWIKDLCRRFHVIEGMFDQWAGIVFEQALHKRGLKQLHSNPMTKQEITHMFRTFKDLMWDKRLVLYDWPIVEGKAHCDYIQELLQLQETRHSKHVITVEAPKVRGKHDDRPDALVRMTYLAAKAAGKTPYIAKGYAAGQGPRRAGPPLSPRQFRENFSKSRRSGSHPSRMVRR